MNLSSLLAVARSVCLKAALWLMFMIFIGSCVQPQSKKPAKTDAKGPVETGGNGPVVFGAIKINEPVGEAYETFDPNAPDKIYNTPEEMAEFPGGYGKLNSFLNKHIVYPETAKENHVEGKVFITFVVEKNGT